ncbi:MAG: IniB N-terminal domain-containing protein [Mycobacterium sp.]
MSVPLIDYILDLFRDPAVAAEFVAEPNAALCGAGYTNVSNAQLNAVAQSAAPAGVALSAGNAVVGLQSAAAEHHGIAPPFSPSAVYAPAPTFAPETNTQAFSNNDINTEVASPDQVSGGNSQVGGFNFAIGDVTFGDKTTTTQTATDGAVIVNGGNEGGDGSDAGSIVIVESDDDTTVTTQTVKTVSPVVVDLAPQELVVPAPEPAAEFAVAPPELGFLEAAPAEPWVGV